MACINCFIIKFSVNLHDCLNIVFFYIYIYSLFVVFMFFFVQICFPSFSDISTKRRLYWRVGRAAPPRLSTTDSVRQLRSVCIKNGYVKILKIINV
jgi:hypothetical protein